MTMSRLPQPPGLLRSMSACWGASARLSLIYEDLMRMGISNERIRELRAPVGLDIGGANSRRDCSEHHVRSVDVPAGRTGSVMKLEERLMGPHREKHGAAAVVAD